MKIIDILKQAKEPPISYEIIPPLRGKSARQVYSVIEELIGFHPPFIDVTSHAADSVYLEQSDGTFKRKIQRKRLKKKQKLVKPLLKKLLSQSKPKKKLKKTFLHKILLIVLMKIKRKLLKKNLKKKL